MGQGAGGVASGAAAGASAGAVAGPWGMAIGAVAGAGLSLAQAGKQAASAKEAQRAAETAARKQEQLLSQDFFSGLQVPMGAYDRASRETTAQVGQVTQALQEGDSRLLAGGLGKVTAAGIAGEAETRDAAAQDLYKLGIAQAQSATNVNTGLADLEAQRLAGAQRTAAEAGAAELAAYGSAAELGIGALNAGLSTISPFGTGKQTPQTPAQLAQTANYYKQAPPGMSTAFNQPASQQATTNQFGPQPNPYPTPDWASSLSFLNKAQ